MEFGGRQRTWRSLREKWKAFSQPVDRSHRAPRRIAGKDGSGSIFESRVGFRSFRWIGDVGLAVVLSPIFLWLPGFQPILFDLFKGQLPSRGLANAVSLTSMFIAVLGIPLLPAFARSILDRRPLSTSALLVSGYFLSVGVISALSTSDLYPVLGALQYILPIAAVVIGFLFRARAILNLQKIVSIFIIVNVLLPASVFSYLFFVDGSRRGVVNVLNVVSLYFYALYSHIPAIILLASVFLLGLVGRRTVGVPSGIVLTATLVTFLGTWSRAAILATVIALVLVVIVIIRRLRVRPSFSSGVQLGVTLFLILSSLVVPRWGMIGYRAKQVVPPSPESPSKVFERSGDTPAPRVEKTADAPAPPVGKAADTPAPPVEKMAERSEEPVKTLLTTSNESRISYMKEGVRRWSEAPLFGVMFKPDETAVIHRRLVKKKQIFLSHNQYLDILLKTGIIGFLLAGGFYALFVVRPLVRAARWAERDGREVVYGVMLAILCGLFAAANFQLYFTVWTTGVPLGFLMGYLVACSDREKKAITPEGRSRRRDPSQASQASSPMREPRPGSGRACRVHVVTHASKRGLA